MLNFYTELSDFLVKHNFSKEMRYILIKSDLKLIKLLLIEKKIRGVFRTPSNI